MSLFDSFKGLFSGDTATNQNTVSQGSSTGASNAAGTTAQTQTTDPRLKAFADWAASQAQTAFQPAQNLVQGAAAPTTFGQVQPLLNPFTQSQIAANFSALQPQFQDQLSQLKGSQSANPYASSNSGAEARLRGQQANTLGQISSGINSQSYGQALGAAQTDAARALQAGQASGSLTASQLGQVIPNVIGAGGQTTSGAGNTSQQGTTSGTTYNTGSSTGTTTYNPSTASIFGGLAGLAGSFLKDGGAVKGYESGGAVKGETSSFAGKVEDAFHAFHRMRKHAESGGKTDESGYDDGGWVPTVAQYLGGPSSDSHWDGVQAAAIANGNPSTSPQAGPSFKDRLGSFEKSLAPPTGMRTPEMMRLSTDNPSLGTLGNVMGSVSSALRPHAADGGLMGNDTPSFASTLWSGLGRLTGSEPAPEAPRSSPARDILRDNYDYEKPDARWQLRRGLLGMSSGVPGLPGPFSSFGGAMDKELESRAEAAKLLEQNAQLTGKTATGQPTMQAQQLRQAAELASGNVGLDGKMMPTLASKQFSEEQRLHDKPTWGVVGSDQYGNPKYGLIDVSKAMPPRGAPTGAAPLPSSASAASTSRVAGGVEDRDPRAPLGSERNPVYAANDATVEPGQYYTTPDNLWPPAYKPKLGEAAPAAARAPVTPERATGLPTGLITESPVTPNRGAADLTGDAFLATLDPADRIKVKHIAEGLEPFPSGMGASKGRGAFLAQAVSQYDPSFDVKNYQMRQKTLNTFKAGPIAEQVKALNTVPGHLEDLYNATEKLGNFAHVPAINAPYNAIRGQLSTDYQKAHAQFDASAAAVSAEMAKVFRASGMSRADFDDWKQLLYSNASPAAIKGAIEKAVQLIDSRSDALKHQWAEGMGPSVPFTAISPKAQGVFDKLRGNKPDDWNGAGSDKGQWTVKRIE